MKKSSRRLGVCVCVLQRKKLWTYFGELFWLHGYRDKEDTGAFWGRSRQ